MLVDTHCHLDDGQFAADREDVIQRALAAGVKTMIAIGTGEGPPDLRAAVRLAEQYDCFQATVGVHPHNAQQWDASVRAELQELTGHPRVRAVGEIGLDYHYDFAPREQQHLVFREQLALAREARLPIVIHTREAWEDTFAILAEAWADAGLPCVLHCFTGGPAEAERALALGFTLSFGGVVTYPKATGVHEAARLTPLDRLLVETDAPYLAPVPHRGRRNEPSFLPATVERLAALRNEPLADVAAATTENASRLFALASKWIGHVDSGGREQRRDG